MPILFAIAGLLLGYIGVQYFGAFVGLLIAVIFGFAAGHKFTKDEAK